mmetsp:Transcript_15308/g.46011  ORF Transcript_15308/g.46011 Transcript_15308/m.46011 type:complete len:201 (+) Transcript_15308:681-1283(+)
MDLGSPWSTSSVMPSATGGPGAPRSGYSGISESRATGAGGSPPPTDAGPAVLSALERVSALEREVPLSENAGRPSSMTWLRRRTLQRASWRCFWTSACSLAPSMFRSATSSGRGASSSSWWSSSSLASSALSFPLKLSKTLTRLRMRSGTPPISELMPASSAAAPSPPGGAPFSASAAATVSKMAVTNSCFSRKPLKSTS